MRSGRVVKSVVLIAMLSVAAFAQPVQATPPPPTADVQCGFFEYVAATDVATGSIEFGASTQFGLHGKFFVIAPGATVPENIGELSGAPTCMRLTMSAGQITDLEYASSGSVNGRVTVLGDPVNDPDNSAYITAGRVATPTFVVDTYPGLRAILGNAVLTGTDVSIKFQIDPDHGFPVAFKATTHLRGEVVLSATDIGVGLGILPAEVIDSASRSTLELAAALGHAEVTVTSQGTIDPSTGNLSVTTTLAVSLTDDAVQGQVWGPCGAQTYYGVFNNSAGATAVQFRLRWTTRSGPQVATKLVPGGAVYTTWAHWAKAGTFVRLSYLNAATGKWVALDAARAVHHTSAPCEYVPGFSLI